MTGTPVRLSPDGEEIGRIVPVDGVRFVCVLFRPGDTRVLPDWYTSIEAADRAVRTAWAADQTPGDA